jgi:hypothetical protein
MEMFSAFVSTEVSSRDVRIPVQHDTTSGDEEGGLEEEEEQEQEEHEEQEKQVQEQQLQAG